MRLSLVRPAAPNTYGGSASSLLPRHADCEPSPPTPLPKGEGRYKESRPRNSTVPPVGRSKRQADLGERASSVVTPAARVAKLGVGSTGGPPSQRLFRQLVINIPAHRAAGQSKQARSGISPIPIRNAGDAPKHRGITPRGASQSSLFFAASLVAFVPGVPQLGLPARPHGAGLAQGGGLRDIRGVHLGTGTCSRVHSSSAPS